MKSFLKKYIPEFVFRYFKIIKNIYLVCMYTFYDFKRFCNNSAAIKGDYSNKLTLISAITMDYHRVEKGLINTNPRLKFGLWFIPKLINNIIYFKENYGNDEMVFSAYSSIKNYEKFHSEKGISLDELGDNLFRLHNCFKEEKVENSFFHLEKEDINNIIDKSNFKEFALTRYSIRNFKNSIINKDIIYEAINIARKTPSVCNRQPWKVYSVNGPKLNEILPLQNGNLGFRNEIKNVLVVVGKISFMRQPIERHQIYIDGGLFSMSLIYALHSLKIGCCPLNWCAKPQNDKLLRKKIGLKDDDEVMMFLAIGEIKDSVIVAASSRMNETSLVKFIN